MKIWIKCVHIFGTGRRKRLADITLLFQYSSLASVSSSLPFHCALCYHRENLIAMFVLLFFIEWQCLNQSSVRYTWNCGLRWRCIPGAHAVLNPCLHSELPRPIPRNSMESDHGCTSRIYYKTATIFLPHQNLAKSNHLSSGAKISKPLKYTHTDIREQNIYNYG